MAEKAPLDTSMTIGTDAVVVLIDRQALNSKRKAYVLTNTSTGGQKITLAYGQVPVSNNGIVLYAGGSDSRTPEQEPTQLAILAISDAAGGILSIHEEVY